MANIPRKRKPGRPPSDAGPNGKPRKSSEYPKMLLILRPETKELLEKLSQVSRRPAWRIVDEAVTKFARGR